MRQQSSARLPKAILFRGPSHPPACRFHCPRGLKAATAAGGLLTPSFTRGFSMTRFGEQLVDARPRLEGLPRGVSSKLEQIASSAPRKIAKRCHCPAWSIATPAFDDCRFGRSLGIRNLDRHAAASVAYKFELRQIAHMVSRFSVDRSVEYMGRKERPAATRRLLRWQLPRR